ADCLDDFFRIDFCGASRIHIWNDCRHTHCSVEQRKKWKSREIDPPRFDVVEIANEIDLCAEHTVLVKHALRRAGATAGKDDGGRVFVATFNDFERRPFSAE